MTSLFIAVLGAGELFGLVADSTFFGKGILVVLSFLSVMSWAIFADKARSLQKIRKGHLEFWNRFDAFLEGNSSNDDLSQWCLENPHLPLCNLYLESMDKHDAPGVRRAAERVTYMEIEALERYLILLSTAVSISPFLGLLGTVWGIMSSFWDMSTSQSANLTVVAPGIAEALVTTIAGLATAIPAVIFFNSLVRKIDLVGNELDRLRTILEEEVGGGRGVVAPQSRDQARRPDVHDGGSI